MTDPQPRRRKTRTREHVIADLGVNFVERQILLAGFTAERIANDYGIDLYVTTFGPTGEVENGEIKLQVKATDSPTSLVDGSAVVVRVDAGDLKYWLFEWVPVVLVLYDAAADRAVWLDVQEYAAERELDEEPGGQTVSLRVPAANLVEVPAVGRWRERLDQVRNRPRRPANPGGTGGQTETRGGDGTN